MTTLYTVEQLELLRRLRGTGISIDMVAEAYRTMDQMDTELDKARMAQVAALQAILAPKVSLSAFTSTSPLEMQQTIDITTTAPSMNAQTFETSSPILLQHLRSQAPVPVTISASAASPPVCTPSPHAISSIQTVPLPSTASDSPTFLGQYPTHEGGPSSSPTSLYRPIRSQRTPMREITTLDDPRELDDFMKNGEEECIAVMKQFITQYSLRQTTVAMMTGVSQPYISKMLNGNHKELSLRCRKNIYSWYLNIRRHPQKLAAFLNDPQTRLETNGDGELIPQRRERYVFRPVLIRLLEQFFAQTPFPDLNRRVEIATACNNALQIDKKGVGLMPKEIVSPQVVANWFANKRKELRRRSNEGVVPNATGSQAPSDSGSTPSPSNPSMDENDEKMIEPITVPAIKPMDFLLNPSLGLSEGASLLNLLPTTSSCSPTSTQSTFFHSSPVESQHEESLLRVPRAATMLSELTARLQPTSLAESTLSTSFAGEFESHINASSMLSSFLNGMIGANAITPEAIACGIKHEAD